METVAKFRFISLELSKVALGRLKPKFVFFFSILLKSLKVVFCYGALFSEVRYLCA